MHIPFVNRTKELAVLEIARRSGGLVVVVGRRRVGKTRVLTRWLEQHHGHYSQAIEAPVALQLQQLTDDLRESGLELPATPKDWNELLRMLSLLHPKQPVCIDELPYLIASAPELPSLLQKWVDHKMPKGMTLVLGGSSRRMMGATFLDHASPLYGRARVVLNVEPMSYLELCKALHLAPGKLDSFVRYAMVGGLPHHWAFLDTARTAVENADDLYFGFAPPLEREPATMLSDEGLDGVLPRAILESIGRGAERLTEIAARCGVAVSSLNRPLGLLLDMGVLERQLPYGESLRTTKRTLYRIKDPSTRFWYRVYSPFRSRWHAMNAAQRRTLIEEHAASVIEDEVRKLFPEGSRYWEAGAEFDLVHPIDGDPQRLCIVEVKWRSHERDRARAVAEHTARVPRTKLAGRVAEIVVMTAEEALRLIAGRRAT